MDFEKIVDASERRLRAQGTRERAEQEKRYLKSELRFLGAGQPLVRREAKALSRAHPELSHAELLRLCTALWQRGVHELRSVCIGLLEARLDLLTGRDLAFLITLVRDSKSWAHVDWLSTKVIGGLVARDPSLGCKLDSWAKDEDFWVRRSALLSLHDPILQGKGNFEHFARLATPMLGEREFFIRKAIGWMLRSASKRRPERTYTFVAAHARALSGLSFREAIKHLPTEQQRVLTVLRSSRA